MPSRFYIPTPLQLQPGAQLLLPEGPSRHAQVLRLQPGDPLILFDGEGGQWQAQVHSMGRKSVEAVVGEPLPTDRAEAPRRVTIAVGMPANERMDFLVEKAVELGVAAIQPLVCERSVLRLSGERAERKQAHWQAVAVAACEQSGRTRVPRVAPVRGLLPWLASLGPVSAGDGDRWLLSTRGARPLRQLAAGSTGPSTLLSGPEGGWSEAEEAAARLAGFTPVSLGPRVLRADTAPLAALAWWSLNDDGVDDDGAVAATPPGG